MKLNTNSHKLEIGKCIRFTVLKARYLSTKVLSFLPKSEVMTNDLDLGNRLRLVTKAYVISFKNYKGKVNNYESCIE